MKTARLLPVLLLTTWMIFGCAGTAHRRSHGVKLSKAIEKASDDHRGERRIETRTPRPYRPRAHRTETPHQMHDPEPSATVPAVAVSPPPSMEKEPWLVGLSAGYGIIRGDDIYQFDNDVFGDFYTMKVRLTTSFLF